jgi:hypothetical protein
VSEEGTGEAAHVMIVNSQSETIAGPSASHHRPEIDPTGWAKIVPSFYYTKLIVATLPSFRREQSSGSVVG